MAGQHVIPTSDSPNIFIERIDGDVSVRGWGRQEISIAADPERLDVQQGDDMVRITVRSDASLQVPVNSRLLVQHVAGDISLTCVSGPVALQEVRGDASVRSVGPLTIGHIGDDLSVRLVHGDCNIERVGEDASVAQIAGNLIVAHVEEDLAISNVRGSIRAESGEDISLRLTLLPGCSYDVRAGNDLSCRIPAASSARVSLQAGDTLKIQRIDAPPVTGHSATFQMGAGEATLSLVAGDDLALVGADGESSADFSFEFGPEVAARLTEFAQNLAAQIEQQVGSVGRQLDEKLASMGGGEEVASKIQEKILAAARRAEEKITEAMRAAEARGREAEARGREAEARGREAERRASDANTARGRGPAGWPGAGWGPPPPARAPRNAAPPVSEEERLAVLRMVSDGKISVEQAETLLAALNGRGGGDD